MNRISIDRLEIRLRGVSPQAARAVSAHLGRELLAQLAEERGLLARTDAVSIADLDAGTLPVPRNGSASQLRRAVVAGIARAIASKEQPPNGKEA